MNTQDLIKKWEEKIALTEIDINNSVEWKDRDSTNNYEGRLNAIFEFITDLKQLDGLHDKQNQVCDCNIHQACKICAKDKDIDWDSIFPKQTKRSDLHCNEIRLCVVPINYTKLNK